MVPADADGVELTVANDGPDIDAQLLPRLFDRFVKAAQPGSADVGTGLGLSIVASIAAAHHGTVHVESSSGRTAFIVRLPLRG